MKPQRRQAGCGTALFNVAAVLFLVVLALKAGTQ